MDIIQLYQDFSVDYQTEGHKHCRPGWVNTPCPFCTGNPGYHLGYNLYGDYFFCWRCGPKQTDYTISKLLNIAYSQAQDIGKQYGLLVSDIPIKVEIKRKAFKYPTGVGPLENNHIRYLQERNFDPDHLIELWDLQATGPISKLDNIDYKHRIIIPYEWDKQIVSFDSRSITIHGSDKTRYKACPKERETIDHKNILYGKQKYWKSTGICVEGPTDVWRLGPFSFAVSGIQYTPKQVRTIAKNFKRVPVLFDPEPEAIIQADKLIADLRFRGLDSFRVDLKQDPGSLSQEEADYIVKQLIN